MNNLLSVKSVSKTYNKNIRVLSDIFLDVHHGEFLALLGPSGCGKTTLLATLAGFIKPDTGQVQIEGNDVTNLPAYKRPLNTVFQSYALFPHMTVLANVSYGPIRAGINKKEAQKSALEALEMVGLANLADRYPADMSGGQRQRVALARAIVNKPKLLLLDEPLSALDMKLRKHMQRELKNLQEKLGISFIFVTHDQEEALAMADRIVVMNQGYIEQIGTGEEIYHKPENKFVADFIGEANLLACEQIGDEIRLKCTGDVIGHITDTNVPDPRLAMYRPEAITLGQENDQGTKAVIESLLNTGSTTTYFLKLGEEHISVQKINANSPSFNKGDTVSINFPQHVHFVQA